MERPAGNTRKDRGLQGLLSIFAVCGVVASGSYLWLHTQHSEHIADATPTAQVGSSANQRGGRGERVPVEQHASAVSGVVSDLQGSPIASAEVCAAPPIFVDPVPRSNCVRSGDDGRYKIKALAAGSYVVSATAQGFKQGASQRGDALVVHPERTLENVDIRLEPGGVRLAGQVLDALGGPVVGSVVRANTPGYQPLSTRVATDDEGHFTLWVSEGMLRLSAEAEGYARARRDVVAPSDRVELVLTPESRIEGTVVTAIDGTPVSDVEVRAVPAHMPAAPAKQSAISDEEGNFALRGLEPGTYLLLAKGARSAGATTRPLEVGLATTVKDVTVEVQAGIQIDSKVVVAETGEPCSHGRVGLMGSPDPFSPLPANEPAETYARTSVQPQFASLKPDGSAHFKGVPPGRYHVHVQCMNYMRSDGPRLLEVGSEDIGLLTWSVVPAITLVVRALDAQSKPVPATTLMLHMPPPGPGQPPGRMGLFTDEQGFARAVNMMPGTYEVHPHGAPGGEPVTVHARPGAGEVPVNVKLHGSGSIVVTIYDEEGQPVDGLQVQATQVTQGLAVKSISLQQGATGAKPQSSQALGQGRYRIAPLLAGSYRVEARDGTNPPVTNESVVVFDAREAPLRLKLSRLGRIRGRVVDEHGAPVAHAWVRAQPSKKERNVRRFDLGSGRVLSNAEGEFELRGLATGEALFEVTASQDFGSEGHASDVRAGQTVTLTLSHAAELSGVVVDEAGRPVIAAFVNAAPTRGEPARSARSEPPDGRFHITGLTPGSVQLRALRQSRMSPEQSVTVAPGGHTQGLRLMLLPEGSEFAQAAPPTSP